MPRLNGHAGRPHFGAMRSLAREIGDFDADVLRRSHEHLVLAEFWAPWCVACARLHPALEHIAARLGSRVELASVNIDMQPEAAAAQGVHGLPLVKAYAAGHAIGELSGVLPEHAIQDWIDGLFTTARDAGLLPARAAGTPTEEKTP